MAKRLSWLVLLGWLVGLPNWLWAWGHEGHRFITSRALDQLPSPLRQFFEQHRPFIVEHSVDPDYWRLAGFQGEENRHFFNLDAYGSYPFSALPRDFDAAVRQYGRDTAGRNGLLPWRAAEIYDRLVAAFAEQKSGKGGQALDKICFLSAVLAHYLEDAHVPFHATLNHDGQLTNQPGVHARFESELFLRYRAQLNIAHTPLEPADNARDCVFKALMECFPDVKPLLDADRQASGRQPKYGDDYFRKFALRALPLMEREINASIRDVASIIYGAWKAGGQPELPAHAAGKGSPARKQ